MSGSCQFCGRPAQFEVKFTSKRAVRVCEEHEAKLRTSARVLAGTAAELAGQAVSHHFPNAMRLGAAVFQAVRAGLAAQPPAEPDRGDL